MRTAGAAAIALLVAAMIAGCSASGSEGTDDPGASVGAGGEGGDLGFDPDATGGGGPGPNETCLTAEAEAGARPLDMVIVLDRSGSMEGDLWDGSVEALSAFFSEGETEDVSAAINYFPPPGGGDECNTGSYNPPQVPLAPLGSDASVLIADMEGQSPAGDYTPTYGALFGSLQYATLLQDEHPDHSVIVVLASDGDPTSCDTDIDTIAELAAITLSYNGVRTFVVAIDGATLVNLDIIADAGGSGAAFDITGDIGLFTDKLEEIRQAAVGCHYPLPDPGEPPSFDVKQAYVVHTPGDSDDADAIPKADSFVDCGDEPGWYYDHPTSPTAILFCPATCAVLEDDLEGSVEFRFGCPDIAG